MNQRKKYLILLFLISFLGSCVYGQEICTGNLGENIFLDGDFGSGEANNVQVNPNIAPGYQYATNGPINDGFYILTNNMGAWNNFPTWLNIGDNSNDPEGYMMVVNASFEPGIFYEKTITGFCENTLYEFSADIINIVGRNVSNHIEPNVDFLINGVTEYNTGNIPQDETWKKYGFTFTVPPGSTEIILTLRNNAPGGTGNDLALDNISFRACGPKTFINAEETIFLCEAQNDPARISAELGMTNSVIQWQESLDMGSTWTNIPGETNPDLFHTNFSPGTYQYRYLSAGTTSNLGNLLCRVLSDIITIEVTPINHLVIDSICQGGPGFQLGPDLITQSGIFMAQLIGTNGCDSNVTLDLTVLADPNIQFDAMVFDLDCGGEMTGSIQIDNIQNGFPPYQICSADSLINSPFDQLAAGLYQISVKDRYGCQASQSLTVDEPIPFTVNIGPDLMASLGEEINLNAVSNYPVQVHSWSPAFGLTCTDCPNPILIAGNDQSYLYTATNVNGCIAVDSIFIEVDRDNIPLFVPNIFTPNGDNINDFLFLSSAGQSVVEILELTIFDRWGNQFFNKQNFPPNIPQEGWNGKDGLKFLNTGVFIYVFRLRLADGSEKVLSGDVTLIR